MSLDPNTVRGSATVGQDGTRWYTAAQAAQLLGVTRGATEGRVRAEKYTTTRDDELLKAAPRGRGPRPTYLILANEVDEERAATLQRLGVEEPGPSGPADSTHDELTKARRRLAQLEPAYHAALRAQDLAAKRRQLEAERQRIHAREAAVDQEERALLLEQLRQFYGPVDIDDLFDSDIVLEAD